MARLKFFNFSEAIWCGIWIKLSGNRILTVFFIVFVTACFINGSILAAVWFSMKNNNLRSVSVPINPSWSSRMPDLYGFENNATLGEPVYLLRDIQITHYMLREKLPKWHKLPADFSRYVCDPLTSAKDYTILPKPCWIFPKPIFMMILVTSRPEGFTLRMAIRSTWASLAEPECGIYLVFVVGETNKNDVQQWLVREASQFGDILQTNRFIDNYRSQALKTMYLFQWACAFCPKSSFTVKMDDDNWLNLERYAGFLKDHEGQWAVFGQPPPDSANVHRTVISKYHVPREDYEPNVYIPYMSGILYAYPTKALAKMLYFAKHLNTGQMEDAFWTGLLASVVNLTRVLLPDFYWNVDLSSQCLKRTATCVHQLTEKMMYSYWNDTCHTLRRICTVLH